MHATQDSQPEKDFLLSVALHRQYRPIPLVKTRRFRIFFLSSAETITRNFSETLCLYEAMSTKNISHKTFRDISSVTHTLQKDCKRTLLVYQNLSLSHTHAQTHINKNAHKRTHKDRNTQKHIHAQTEPITHARTHTKHTHKQKRTHTHRNTHTRTNRTNQSRTHKHTRTKHTIQQLCMARNTT